MGKSRIFLSLAVMAIAAAYLQGNSESDPPSSQTHETAFQSGKSEVGRAEFSREGVVTSEARQAGEGTTSRVNAGIGSVRLFKQAVRDFSKNQFSIEGMGLNRESIEKLASQDEAVELSRKILENAEWTIAKFGDVQAEARVLAIKVLSERAHRGDVRPLTEAAAQLGASFSQLERGQRADLRDLLTELISAVGIARFYDDPSIVMQSFSNPGEVRKTVIAASVAHLGESINDPEFVERMGRWR